jgi:hypothetical protein
MTQNTKDAGASLLPCPFCGGKANFSRNEFHGDDSMATCACCGATAFWRKWNERIAPTAEQAEGVRVGESVAAFALRALVAAGHVPQSKVDEALAIAANTPGVLAACSGDDPIDAEDLEKLPALAKTKLGKRLYYMAYARGRASERRKASGEVRVKPRTIAPEATSRHEMRLMLPEGGHVNLFWPDELTADSALMLSEMFATVMQAFARAATAKPNVAPASSTGEQA